METICDLLENGDVALDFEDEPAQAQTIRILANIVGAELDALRTRNWIFGSPDYYDNSHLFSDILPKGDEEE